MARVLSLTHRLVLSASFTSLVAGCSQTLFPVNAPRTQFESSERMRNTEAPLTEPDVFGRPQPALRERLGT